MMPPGNEAHEAPSNGASATAYEKLQRGHTSQVRANVQRQILNKYKYKCAKTKTITNAKTKTPPMGSCREAHLASKSKCGKTKTDI